jgi:hypothetical protein
MIEVVICYLRENDMQKKENKENSKKQRDRNFRI